MLLLTRRPNEALILNVGGKLVRILVMETYRQGSVEKVRIGIEAPREIPVFRSELETNLETFNYRRDR